MPMRSLPVAAAVAGLLTSALAITPSFSPVAQAADTNCPVPSSSLGGTGTSGDPWLISTPGDLQLLKNDTTLWPGDKYFVQTANIDMFDSAGNACVWDRGIGSTSTNSLQNAFESTYDGGGFEIRGLNIVTGNVSAGLFGWVRSFGFTDNGGVVKNVGFTGNVTSTSADGSVGGLVGYASLNTGSHVASIRDSYATGTITASGDRVGGLVGQINTSDLVTVERSFATGNVSSSRSIAGGAVGYWNSTNGVLRDTYATGDVTATAGSFLAGAGGLIGYGDKTGGNESVEYSIALGTATGGGSENGGFAGQLTSSVTVTSSFFNSDSNASAGNIDGSRGSPTGDSIANLKTLSTYTGNGWTATTGSGSIAGGFDPTKTWGICPNINDGFPFLTTFYPASSDPCTDNNSPTPTFDTPVPTADGFTVNVTNYDPFFWWDPTVSLGSVASGTPSGSSLPLTVSGVTSGVSATLTMTTSRSALDYVNATGTVSATAGSAAPTPTFDTPVPTSDGFTVNVTNYDNSYNWTQTVDAGSVSAGAAVGGSLPLTVTTLSPGASATITVTASQTGYTDGIGTVTGTAISNGLTPTFGTPVSTSTGFTVAVTNYDANYTWTPSVSAGSVSTGTASGSTLPLTVTGLTAGETATVTMITSRAGYDNGSAAIAGASLVARATPSPTSLDFGLQAVGSTSSLQTLTITSSGTTDLVIGAGATSITGSDAAMFTIDADNCSGQTLSPSQTCSIDVSFAPTSDGEKLATLRVNSNDPASPTTVELSGGERVVPVPQMFTFWFHTAGGGTCLDSVQVTDTHIFKLPGSDVSCVPLGDTLVGWSIRGQEWNFAPGAEVVVSGDQTFTAVSASEFIEVTLDANVGRGTPCLAMGRDITRLRSRKIDVALIRSADTVIPLRPICAPEGFVFNGWSSADTPSGSGSPQEGAIIIQVGQALPSEWLEKKTTPLNKLHLYALWDRSIS